MRCRALVLVLLCSVPARAEPDRFGFGDGHRGSALISTSRTINSYAVLTSSTSAGAATASLSSTIGFTAGELVVFIQMQSAIVTADSGVTEPIDLTADSVGAFEFARIDSIIGSTVRFTQPLSQSFVGQLTQVVTVPEYSDVTVSDGGVITAPAWNGSTGGVVALMCTGTFTNDGVISTAGLGFRGGASPTSVGTTCSGLDDAAAGSKGESLVPQAFGATVRGVGNIGNGGGGSNCVDPVRGGGGGAQLGRGGNGSLLGGGLGGRPIVFEPRERLLFGGGGGAGGVVAIVSAAGGSGGGIVIVRCANIDGSGTFDASGLDGRENVYMDSAPGGGGGAGGTIWLQAAQRLSCHSARAEGGRGADSNRIDSAAGGGGGGVVLLQSSSGSCTASARAGRAGQWGGQPTTAGPVEIDQPPAVGRLVVMASGLSAPPPPTITSPMNFARVSARPWITGTASVGSTASIWAGSMKVAEFPVSGQAFAGAVDIALPPGLVGLHATVREANLESGPSDRVFVEVEELNDAGRTTPSGPTGVLAETESYARCDRPFEFSPVAFGSPGPYSLEPINSSELPAGIEVDATSGTVRWRPTADQTGTHVVVLRPTHGTPLALRVTVTCEYRVCGCSSHDAGLLALVVLLRRRKRSSSAIDLERVRRSSPPS